MKHRQPQLILIVCLLVTCWLGMQEVHEFGHVLGAWYTGGVVTKVVLRPWTISRTDLSFNPAPPTVTWAGPLLGAALPLAAWSAAALLQCPCSYLLRFFAGFCLVTNGAYIGGGAVYRAGDAATLLDHGSPTWPLYLFAAATVPLGLWLWHRQGHYFGLAGAGGNVDGRTVVVCGVALVLVVVVEFVFGSA
jgi:hypothetical protein